MSEKKVVAVIVEGSSDESAIGSILLNYSYSRYRWGIYQRMCEGRGSRGGRYSIL